MWKTLILCSTLQTPHLWYHKYSCTSDFRIRLKGHLKLSKSCRGRTPDPKLQTSALTTNALRSLRIQYFMTQTAASLIIKTETLTEEATQYLSFNKIIEFY